MIQYVFISPQVSVVVQGIEPWNPNSLHLCGDSKAVCDSRRINQPSPPGTWATSLCVRLKVLGEGQPFAKYLYEFARSKCHCPQLLLRDKDLLALPEGTAGAIAPVEYLSVLYCCFDHCCFSPLSVSVVCVARMRSPLYIYTNYPVVLFFLPTFCYLWVVGEQSENLHPN